MMQVFISGTDTNIGKTTICSWLCLHTGYSYFKPIQSGECRDSEEVAKLSGVTVYPEMFLYKAPLSPHLAAALENEEIDVRKVILPASDNLIVEGAGGLLVPINKEYLMIDLIKLLQIPVIIVASSRIGTINHTLLSLESLKNRDIKTLGVIMNGPLNQDNADAIEFYGRTKVLAQVPMLDSVNRANLQNIPLTEDLLATIARPISMK